MASDKKSNDNAPEQKLSIQNTLSKAAEDTENEIDLLELLNVLLSNIRWVIAAVIAGAVIAFFYTQYFVTPMYRSTGSLYVVSSRDAVINLSDLQIGNYLTSDYEKVVYTWEVLQLTSQNLSLPYDQGELRNMISVNIPANTRILEITVQSPSPREAALIANELMSVVSNFIGNVMETEMPNILSEAKVPTQRYSPSKTRNTMLGGVLGGFLSVLVIFIIFMLDDKVKTPDDIMKYTGMPTLSIIPRTTGGQGPGKDKPPAPPPSRRVQKRPPERARQKSAKPSGVAANDLQRRKG